MAAPDISKILRSPGRLSFGGTQMGVTRNNRFEPRPIYRPVFAEEFGTVTDLIYCGERGMFSATLRYPDTDAIADIMVNSTSTVWKFDVNDVRAGTSLFANAAALTFTPTPSTGTTVSFPNAIPALDDGAFLRFAFGEEYGLTVAFWAIPDASGEVYSITEAGG